MTPQQLRHLREARGLTREELARELKCSAGAIVQWEGNSRAIPTWVVDKMLESATITLPLKELHELIDIALQREADFGSILADAIRAYIANQRGEDKVSQFPDPKPAQNPAPQAQKPGQLAAEDPVVYQAKRRSK